MPNTQAQFVTLYQTLRSTGHILEHTPGNISAALHGTQHTRTYAAGTLHTDGYTPLPTNEPGVSSSHGSPPYGEHDSWSSGLAAGCPPPPHQHIYTANASDMEGYDSGTDTDTASDFECDETFQEFAGMAHEDIQQDLFWALERAKSRWRQYMNKPIRKVRRFFRKRLRGKGKGKGSGKRPTGKGVWTYTANLSDEVYEELYFGGCGKGKGRGKGVGKRSTGKGSGRTTNPIRRDGEIMKCAIPNCQSTTHLWRQCPP